MLHARMLRYLDEVARSGSIRRAAEGLNVASSSINRQILELEADFGTPIFERLPNRLRLTSFGELLLSHIRQTLREYHQIEARINDLKGLRGGEVSIATMNGLASGIIPSVVADFSARYPRVKVTSRALFSGEVVQAVLDGEADLGFGYNLPESAGLYVMEIFDARLGAVISPGHPLASQTPVRLSECSLYPTILADSSMVLHHTMIAAFARSRITIEPRFLSNSVEFMKVLASRGEGVAFLSRFDVYEEERAGRLIYLPIRERSLGKNQISLVHRANRPLDRAASLVAEDLRRELHLLIHSPPIREQVSVRP